MYLSRTGEQFYETTKKVKLMKREFTTNWHIYRVCSLSICTPKLQCDTDENASTSEPLPHNRGFKKLLLEAIDDGLSSLGDPAKLAIYIYLEKNFKIKKQEIPNKINEFTNAIEKIFGNGVKFLEIQIMKHLYEKVGHNFRYFPEEDDLLFTEYIEAASH
jgi:hypothetical protein